jgi:CSL zinc finger
VLSDPAARKAYDEQLALQAVQGDVTVSDEVSLEEMTLCQDSNPAYYSYPCRCGDHYIMSCDSVGLGISSVILGCASCSLYLQVRGIPVG